MSTQLLVLLLPFVVEDQDLIAAPLLHDFADDSRFRLWPPDLARLARDRQHIAELNLPVCAVALALHPNHIAGRHPVLLSSGADNRVHTYASVESMPVAHCREPGEPTDFPVLPVSASTLSATIAGGSRTEPRVQANSVILACAAERRQTRVGNSLVFWRLPRSAVEGVLCGLPILCDNFSPNRRKPNAEALFDRPDLRRRPQSFDPCRIQEVRQESGPQWPRPRQGLHAKNLGWLGHARPL